MKRYLQQHLVLGSIGLLALAGPSMCSAADLYHPLKEISVGGEGGWDYLSVDESARRLYVTHGTKVVVIDIDKEAVVGEIKDTPGVHGFALATKLGIGFSSNGLEAKASMVDLKTLQTTSKVATGKGPDAIIYDPGQEEMYVFNGRDKSATVLEAKTGKVVATVALSGRPEFAAADPSAHRVFCNLEDKSEVVAIDTKTHTVVNNWPIAPGQEASGMAIDLDHHRLFLGCGNKLMVMMDSTNGKVVMTVPIGDRVDANAFDASTQLAFSSNGEGTVTIAHEDSPDKLTVVQTLKTQKGAKTMALDPKTHKIFLPAGSGESFRVLVYGK